MNKQLQKIWFENGKPPSEASRRAAVSSNNQECPLNRFIGNSLAVDRFRVAAFNALGNHNHYCGYLNYALYGPASTGKTTLARLFAETVGLPFIEINAGSVKTVGGLIEKIKQVLKNYRIITPEGAETSCDLVPCEENIYCLPPMIIFIDEIHQASKAFQDKLLKATEKNDNILTSEEEKGKNNIIYTQWACWMIATTNRGNLDKAFDTRFCEINLKMYSKNEISKIIHNEYGKTFSKEACDKIASFAPKLPRKALAFAREVNTSYNYLGGSLTEAINYAAKVNNIDKFGMPQQCVEVLRHLGRGPVSKHRLSTLLRVEEETLEKFILPELDETPDQKPLISICRRGYLITKDGLSELDKREISHCGQEATHED